LGKDIRKERFSAREFWRIEKLLKEKVGIREIGMLLDRAPSNISRQVNNPRNQDEFRIHKKWVKRFSAVKAVETQQEGKKGRGRIAKLAKDPRLREYLEEAIKKKRWSPKIALGRAKKDGLVFTESVSIKTIYNSIYRGDISIDLFDLWLKLRRSPSKEKVIRMWKKSLGKRIDERPDISDRKEFGHWEIDTVFWGRSFSILVIVERKTRYCKLIKLSEHTSAEVNEKLRALNLPFATLTADNGSEFAGLAQLFENTYFTHPYSSWEKGSVENLNGIIRRYLPRNTSIDKITEERLAEVEAKINDLPRPILDFYTARELYERETKKAA